MVEQINKCFDCGSEAILQEWNKRWGVFCVSCRPMSGYYNVKEDAIKHWNEDYLIKKKPTEEQMNNLINLMRTR